MSNSMPNTTPGTRDAGRRGEARPRRAARQSLLALMAILAGFVLLGATCDGSSNSESSDSESSQSDDAGTDSGSSEDDGTDSEGTDSEGTDSGGTDSGDTESDDSGSSGSESAEVDVDAARERVEAATDSCEVVEASTALFGSEPPANAEEAREFVDSFVLMLNKMADTSSDAALGDQLRTAATNLQQFAEDNDYDPEKMNFEGQPTYEGSEQDFAAIDQWSANEVAECMPSAAEAPTP